LERLRAPPREVFDSTSFGVPQGRLGFPRLRAGGRLSWAYSAPFGSVLGRIASLSIRSISSACCRGRRRGDHGRNRLSLKKPLYVALRVEAD
jgi:hypothetical protein